MSKRNTVRINMDLLDGYLKAKNIHPKDFCEKQLGFSDGWYYGIRKKDGRGVKVLVAQLIARSIGVEYETLVIDEKDVVKKETINARIDTGKENGNPSITVGASPRPTETREVKTLFSDYVDMEKELEFRRALLEEARLEIKNAYEQIEELKQEKVNLSFKLEQAEACFHPTERAEERGTGNPSPTADEKAKLFQKIDALKMDNILLKKDIEEKEKALAVAFEQIEALGRKAEDGVIPVHINDFIHILETALSNQIVKNEMNNDKLFGYVDCFITLRYLANKRKEKAKNARPEED